MGRKLWEVESVGVVGENWSGWMNLVEVVRHGKSPQPTTHSRDILGDLLFAESVTGLFQSGGGKSKVKITRLA